MSALDLTIAGVPCRVRKGSWKSLPSLYQGGDSRQDDMSVVSTVDPATEILVWECEVFFTSDADLATLKASCPPGTPVTIAGFLPGASVSAYVRVQGGSSLSVRVGGVRSVYRTLALHIEQAEP